MIDKNSYDVCVIGGGAAGVSAAISAAETGASVLLIERNPYFGGEATHSNVTAYCGFYTRGKPLKQVVFGFGQRVLNSLKDLGADVIPFTSPASGNTSIRFDPELIKIVMDTLLQNSKVTYLLHTRVISVNASNNLIESIKCIDDEDTFEIKAKSFIDCTGDGNVAHMAGLQTMWGNENRQTQMASLSCRVDHLPTIDEIDPKLMTQAILEGKSEGRPYLYKEKGFLIKEPNADYGFLTIPSVFVKDLTGKTLTECEQNLRKQAQAYVSLFNEKVPLLKNMRLVSTGPMIGIRESRRIYGKSILTYEEIMACKKPQDTIAKGGWSPEVHKDEKNYDFHYLPDGEYFGIPLSALQSRDLENLWAAGRNISCDSYTHGSLRVMGTGFATGQAAGVAAAMQVQGALSITAIQKVLEDQNAHLADVPHNTKI